MTYELAFIEEVENRINKKIKMSIQNTKIRKEIIDLLGGKCNICGFNDIRALQIDHVNDDGKLDRERYNSNMTLYKIILERIKNGSKNYQCLCANHNIIKEHKRRTNYIDGCKIDDFKVLSSMKLNLEKEMSIII
jgi:hypothetical protein